MKVFLGWVVIIAVVLWIVDSSGWGYNKWTQVGTPQETQRILGLTPIGAYIHIGQYEGALGEYATVSDLVRAMGKRQKAQRYSIFGRKLVDNGPQPKNFVELKFFGHQGFQPWFKFGDPQQDLGPEAAEYLKEAAFRNPAPPGFQPQEEPVYSQIPLK